MRKPEAPCRDCEDRTLGCHATCKRYESYVDSKEEYAALIYNKRRQADACIEWSPARRKSLLGKKK